MIMSKLRSYFIMILSQIILYYGTVLNTLSEHINQISVINIDEFSDMFCDKNKTFKNNMRRKMGT